MPQGPYEPALGDPMPDFRLMATDGAWHDLAALRGPRGLVVAFICNHCPFVVAIAPRLDAVARALDDMGIGMAAICSNDSVNYPADSFENMGKFALEHGFSFPYLHDADQRVARAWGAACTPEFFGLNGSGLLQYHGRLDDAGRNPATAQTQPELLDAMARVAETGFGPQAQNAAIGCSIKWKAA